MLIIFFDYQWIVYKELVSQSTTVTSIFYKCVLERLLKCITRVCPKKFKNAIFSSCITMYHHTRSLLTNISSCQMRLNHPPYSPDLSTSDCFAFPKLKFELKGYRFESIEDVQKADRQVAKDYSS